MDLDSALKQFDIAESNLTKLEAVWNELRRIMPEGIVFPGDSPEDREYRKLCRDYETLLRGLPKIDGWTISFGYRF